LFQNTIAALCLVIGFAGVSSAQIIESVGTRAMGMGGAFTAVASDSTATWWNPAGLAAGALSDMSIGRAVTDLKVGVPARRDRVSWFAASAPAVGFSLYRLRITDIRGFGPTGEPVVNREDTRAGVSVRSFSASELGLTLVQSILPGIHAGATLKYVRGTVRSGLDDAARPIGDLLDSGDDLTGGHTEGHFDLDAGVIAIAGPLHLGAVMRNVTHPQFGDASADATVRRPFELPRQTRVGAALNFGQASPLTLAVDADAKSYTTGTGERRVIAGGIEQWLAGKRLGLRAGARENRVGAKQRTATGGASIALRRSFYVEGDIVRGGSIAERGWSIDTRVSF
jgi:hypothetical protein